MHDKRFAETQCHHVETSDKVAIINPIMSRIIETRVDVKVTVASSAANMARRWCHRDNSMLFNPFHSGLFAQYGNLIRDSGMQSESILTSLQFLINSAFVHEDSKHEMVVLLFCLIEARVNKELRQTITGTWDTINKRVRHRVRVSAKPSNELNSDKFITKVSNIALAKFIIVLQLGYF